MPQDPCRCSRRTNCTVLSVERVDTNTAVSPQGFAALTKIGMKATHLELWLRNGSVSLSSRRIEINDTSDSISAYFRFVINYGREINRSRMKGYEFGGYDSAQHVLV